MYIAHIWYSDFITKPCLFALQDSGTGLQEREPEIVQQEERLKVQVSCVFCKVFCMPDKTVFAYILRAYLAA